MNKSFFKSLLFKVSFFFFHIARHLTGMVFSLCCMLFWSRITAHLDSTELFGMLSDQTQMYHLWAGMG